MSVMSIHRWKADRACKTAEKKAEAKEKKPAAQREAAKVNLIFQSQAGNPVTPADIAKKVPKEATDAYVKMEENRIYYVLKDGNTGDVEIW